MKKDMYHSDDFRLATLAAAGLALKYYRAGLKTKLCARDAMLSGLNRISRQMQKKPALSAPALAIEKTETPEKENNNMKHFVSALAVLAAAGAAVGAAGYYLYKKSQTEENYDDLLITEEMGEEFEIADEAYTDEETIDVEDVKEAIENATEE